MDSGIQLGKEHIDDKVKLMQFGSTVHFMQSSNNKTLLKMIKEGKMNKLYDILLVSGDLHTTDGPHPNSFLLGCAF